MGILRKLVGKVIGDAPGPAAAPPEWASFFAPRQYRLFQSLVNGYFRRLGKPYVLEEGVVHVGEKGTEDEQHLGLMNLAQMCFQNPETAWKSVIQTHFEGVAKSWREQAALDERLTDYDRVADLLAVRIWPRSFLQEATSDDLIYREDLDGTVTMLVFDLPTSIRGVRVEETKTWGKTTEELFEIGLANVLENCIPDHAANELDEGVTLHAYIDDNFFVATHALLLEHHPEAVGEHGALIGIPHRHALLAHPIDGLGVIRAIHRMVPIIHGMEHEGPGSITANLYWHAPDGRFVHLPYELDKTALKFFPPIEFLELLTELGVDGVGEAAEDE